MSEITIKLRLAEPEEFAVRKDKIKTGLLYCLKSTQTGKFDRGVYYTYDGMNLEDLRQWFIYKMVYVPISSIDSVTVLEE